MDPICPQRNQHRLDLINKKYEVGLNDQEEEELKALQEWLAGELNRLYPLPLPERSADL
jgi:hypothetical protein